MVAYIDTPQSRVKVQSKRLVIHGLSPSGESGQIIGRIPLAGLERVVLNERVQITSQALCALFRAGVAVHYIDGRGRILGQATGPSSTDAEARLDQYRRSLDPEFALSIARRLVSAKVYNQHRVLQRLHSTRPKLNPNELRRLPPYQTRAERTGNLPQLLGCEGAATSLYFNMWQQFLPSEFPFERRSTRPPLNAINACISFGATLLYQEMVGHIQLRGLDPAFGLLHNPANGRWSLALDLIEPFRPCLPEALTMRLFSHRMLSQKDFEPRNGGIYLNERGRKIFIEQYERRLERRFLSEQAGHRTTLRQALIEQVVSLKNALQNPETFNAFHLN